LDGRVLSIEKPSLKRQMTQIHADEKPNRFPVISEAQPRLFKIKS
jgi:hypothetical protein